MWMQKIVGVFGAVPRPTALAMLADLETGVTAAGSTQATARLLTAANTVVSTAAAGTGVIIPASLELGDVTTVTNLGANALLVYPPIGGVIQTGATNAGFSVATGKQVVVKKVTATLFVAMTG